jgi:AcrR family transcriptional regulator
MPRRSAADAARTRLALTDAARACFVADGYRATTTTAIATLAGCSQSALFHHFADKAELFESVILAELRAYDKQVGRAAVSATGGPLAQVLAGCRRSLELASDPAWSRLVAVDAPAALGSDRLHNLDADLGLKSTTFAIELLIAQHILDTDTDVDALALVLYGSLTSAAFEMARYHAGAPRPRPDVLGESVLKSPPDVDRVMLVIERLILAHTTSR